MLKTGLFLACVLVDGKKGGKSYVICEYRYDTQAIENAVAEIRTINKENLIAGMRKGIKFENIAFTDEDKKNAIKGTKGPLASLEVECHDLARVWHVESPSDYIVVRYAAATTSEKADKALVVNVRVFKRHDTSIKADASVSIMHNMDVAKYNYRQLLSNFKFMTSNGELRFEGNTTSLPVIREEKKVEILENNIVDYIKGANNLRGVTGDIVSEAEIFNAILSTCTFTGTELDAIANNAVDTFCKDNPSTVVVHNFSEIIKRALYLDSSAGYIGEFLPWSTEDKELFDKIKVINALACPNVDITKIGAIDIDSSADMAEYNGIAVLSCLNGSLIVDIKSNKVMKAIGVSCRKLSSVMLDTLLAVDSTIRIIEESYIEIRTPNDIKTVGIEQFKDRLILRLSKDLAREKNDGGLFGISKDGKNIVRLLNGKLDVVCEANTKCPGIKTDYIIDTRFNKEATIELAKKLRNNSAELSELAKRNKCGLLAAGPYIGKDLSMADSRFNSNNRIEDVSIYNAADKFLMFIRAYESDEKAWVKPHRSETRKVEALTTDEIRHHMGRFARVGVLTVRHPSGWKVVLQNSNFIFRVKEGTYELANHILNNEKENSLLGRERVVTDSAVRGYCREVLDKYGKEKMPSIGIACALAGVLVAGIPDADGIIKVKGINFYIKELSTGLYIPCFGLKEGVRFGMSTYAHNVLFNAVMNAIRENKEVIEVRARTYNEALEAACMKIMP